MANDETSSASRKESCDCVSSASTTYFLNTKLETIVVASRTENKTLDKVGKVGGGMGVGVGVFPKGEL